MELAGMAAIVTGGASGLGAATVRALIAGGARVAIFDIDEANGPVIAGSMNAQFFAVDVTDENNISSALEAAEQVNGVARVLVNCAGICPVSQIVDDVLQAHSAAVLKRTIGVNLTGSFMMLAQFAARLVATELMGEERGVAINTASIAAFEASAGLAAYAAAKGGVAAMTLPAARDLAPHHIRVASIAPGMFETPMIGHLPNEGKAALASPVPFPNRLGRPEEFARLVLSIIENPMINGSVLRLDGGHRL